MKIIWQEDKNQENKNQTNIGYYHNDKSSSFVQIILMIKSHYKIDINLIKLIFTVELV